uniref:Uncharacterized protein n=1 Tax=Alexandrium andersonii TaxID=327968 RepID=A0A7S2HKM9_9DINO|mmetsp:Transcript_72661/g.162670  ORF Transcript_72661/g.162670 Transcript_72661/m.162670 type:complete len:191 (+) Transcript_72661:82-654(+)
MQSLRANVALVLAVMVSEMVGSHGASTALEVDGKRALRRSRADRVDAIAQSFHVLEIAASLPRNATKEQEDHILKTLQDQVAHLKLTTSKIADVEGHDAAPEERARLVAARSTMKAEDQKMMEKMDAWSQRMNRKTRLGAMDVISKLENSIHLIKKGALSGNKEAAEKLNSVLGKMSSMAGVGTGGNFLH